MGGEKHDESCTTYWFPGEHVAVAWLCVWATRPTATSVRVFILVPGHQISRRCTEYGSGASAPHRLHLWPREEPWMGGGRGGPGLTRVWLGAGVRKKAVLKFLREKKKVSVTHRFPKKTQRLLHVFGHWYPALHAFTHGFPTGRPF